MTRREELLALRADTSVHYNCCQSTLIPFRDLCGIDREKAYQLGLHFGGGMGCGATCGAVTGALMVLGMAGGTPAQAKIFRDAFQTHNGSLTCAELLQIAKDQGIVKKVQCDSLIEHAATMLEELVGQK